MTKKKPAKEYSLGDTCDIKDHRPCELATAVAFAADISVDNGVALTPKLAKIQSSGKGTETQIQAALEEWRYTIPNERRWEADNLIDIVFPAE